MVRGIRSGRGRIIPADAGSTIGTCSGTRVWADHPRGCGEHRLWHWRRCFDRGSSPRMRGAPTDGINHGDGERIIPADAGSTLQKHSDYQTEEDHPRGCGEHFCVSLAIFSHRGSSPRMRGAPGRHRHHLPGRRIIPADAGSTDAIMECLTDSEDHPRGCGEHGTQLYTVHPAEGSSPRMRGAPGGGESTDAFPRIIPADAGSTPN